ncbi:hypothetical protein A2U01_0062259, partial [Trifolium medium]|nr:hypothetical protein [Trifolium medium]
MQIISSVTYSIWYARNRKVFHNIDIPVTETVEAALKTFCEYQHNITSDRIEENPRLPVDRNNISWNPPPRTY